MERIRKCSVSSPLTLEQLQPFCSRDEGRHLLHKPFTRDGWTYATDGRIVIRVPAIDGVEKGEVGAESLFPKAEFREIGLPDSIPHAVKTICSRCHGTGECSCLHCGSDYTCKVCNGSVDIIKDSPIKIEGVALRAAHLRLIKALPGAKLFLNLDPKATHAFTFDGGEGRLAPVSED